MNPIQEEIKTTLARNRPWICLDCKEFTPAFFMVNNDLWAKVVGEYWAGIICPSCFEKRLGRRLEVEDLKPGEPNKNILNGLVFHMLSTGAIVKG